MDKPSQKDIYAFVEKMNIFDDNKSIQGKFIYGFKVFKIEDLKNLIDSLSISEVLIAIPSLTEKQKSFIIKNLSKYPIKVSTIPGITEIAKGNFKIEDRKPINIEDILGREKVPPIHNLLACNIERQNVLVTGAGGSIGSELSRQIIDLKPKSNSDHGACSLLAPHPKFAPAIKIFELL